MEDEIETTYLCLRSYRVEHFATAYESADIPGGTPLFEYTRGGLASTLCIHIFSDLRVHSKPDDIVGVPSFALDGGLVLTKIALEESNVASA
jgi:hypothetical protein